MKKVAIITYYNAPNYGAFMQAFALCMFLKKEGYDPYFIRFIDFKKRLSGDSQKKFYESLLPYINDLPTSVDKIEWDVAIYGSDEIWNLRNKGYYPYLWGYQIHAKKKISYSPSLANTKLLDFFLFPYIIYALRKFNNISVRDVMSKRIISKIVGHDVDITLDPTFLIDYSGFKKENLYGNYVLVYSYGLTEKQHTWIRHFANSRDCKVIYTGQRYDKADYNIYPGPFNWINLYHHAKFVVTTTFHGTVFSILCDKQFICLEASSIKVIDLLSTFGLKNQNITSNQNIKNVPTIDYNEVHKIKDKLVEKSKNYLINNIE